MKLANRQRGFTLIELLVALVILSLIATAGYRGLNAVLQTRERVAEETRKWQHLAFFFRVWNWILRKQFIVRCVMARAILYRSGRVIRR